MAPRKIYSFIFVFIFIFSGVSFAQGLRKNFLALSRYQKKIESFGRLFSREEISFSKLLFFETHEEEPFIGLVKRVDVNASHILLQVKSPLGEGLKSYSLDEIGLQHTIKEFATLGEKDKLYFASHTDFESFYRLILERKNYAKKKKEECEKIFYKLVLEGRTSEKEFTSVLRRTPLKSRNTLIFLRKEFFQTKMERIFVDFVEKYGVYDVNLSGEEVDFSSLDKMAEQFFSLCKESSSTLESLDLESLVSFLRRVSRYCFEDKIKENYENFFTTYSREILYLLKTKSFENGRKIKEAFSSKENFFKKEELLNLMRCESDILFFVGAKKEQEELKLKESLFLKTLTREERGFALDKFTNFEELSHLARFHILLLDELMKGVNPTWHSELKLYLKETFNLEKGREKMDFDPVHGRWAALGRVLTEEIESERLVENRLNLADSMTRLVVREKVFKSFRSNKKTYLDVMRKLYREFISGEKYSLLEAFLKGSQMKQTSQMHLK